MKTAVICKHCEGIYYEKVSQCDCLAPGQKQEFETVTLVPGGMVAVPRELLERIVETRVTEYEIISRQKRELTAILEASQ